MRSRELQQMLATLTDRTIGEVDQRTRPLRQMSEIRTGPRGNAAPHMTNMEAAAHILCLASRRVGDAGDVMQKLLADCCYVPHPDHLDFIGPSGLTLGGIVALIMEHDPSTVHLFRRVEISDTGERAWVTIERRGSIVKLLFSVDPDAVAARIGSAVAAYDQVDNDTVGNRFVVSAPILVAIGVKVAADDPAAAGDTVQWKVG